MPSYRITLECDGVPPQLGEDGAMGIAKGFSDRPWHHNTLCVWDGDRLILSVENDFDYDGKATMDEFSDEISANIRDGFDGTMRVSVLSCEEKDSTKPDRPSLRGA